MSTGLCEEFAAIRRQLEEGNEVDPPAIEALLARIEVEAPDMPRESVVELCGHVEFLEDFVRDAHEEIGNQLRKLSKGNWAMRSYTFLRSNSTGQRLYRKA
jgi:hypothetical protein